MTSKRIRPFLAGLLLAALPMASFAFVTVGVSINIAPPPLPVYEQPPLPAPGYLWTPGYWAWGDGDYYWVPGTWVMAPTPGYLWTPGYWGFVNGLYVWNAGYWGPHVGFYGGVNYGFGYTGVGFAGGYWRGGAFYYNRAAANFGGVHVTNVYNKTIVNNVTINRVSYNGGNGGLSARPSPRELQAAHDRHVEFTPAQRNHERMAFGDHDLRASVNGGRPRIAATERPAVFTGKGVVGTRAAGGPHGNEFHAGDNRANRTDRPPGAGGAAMQGGPAGARPNNFGNPPNHAGNAAAAAPRPGNFQGGTPRPGNFQGGAPNPGNHQGAPARPGNVAGAQPGGAPPAMRPNHFTGPGPGPRSMPPGAAAGEHLAPHSVQNPPREQPHPQGSPQGGPRGEPRGQGHGQGDRERMRR